MSDILCADVLGRGAGEAGGEARWTSPIAASTRQEHLSKNYSGPACCRVSPQCYPSLQARRKRPDFPKALFSLEEGFSGAVHHLPPHHHLWEGWFSSTEYCTYRL